MKLTKFLRVQLQPAHYNNTHRKITILKEPNRGS